MQNLHAHHYALLGLFLTRLSSILRSLADACYASSFPVLKELEGIRQGGDTREEGTQALAAKVLAVLQAEVRREWPWDSRLTGQTNRTYAYLIVHPG